MNATPASRGIDSTRRGGGPVYPWFDTLPNVLTREASRNGVRWINQFALRPSRRG